MDGQHDSANVGLGPGNGQAAGPRNRLQVGTLQYHRRLLAIQRPRREDAGQTKGMQALFRTEAAKYNVFPLDNRAFARLQTPRPSAVAGRTVFTTRVRIPAFRSAMPRTSWTRI